MPITIGEYSSWSVITENVIIKHCDMSIFKNHGSALDMRTRDFWHVEDMKYPNHLQLTLNYAGTDYQAHIEYDQQGRTRIFWTMDLQEQFRKQPHAPGNYPDLRFERVGENRYSISFINFHTVEKDEQDKEETIVEVSSNVEGKKKQIYSTKYERNPKNRADAIRIHGTKCMACGFDFEATYGEHGKDFIEVHHTKPLYSLMEETKINPESDLICLCSNCHRMVHRKKGYCLTLDELKAMISANK